MEVHAPSSEDLKCPTCLQFFTSLDKHKQHYKSDFHRYNLKRKMVKLAPVTQQQFKQKKATSKAQESIQFKCHQCNKKFNSIKTLTQHAQSKKHNISKPIQQTAEKEQVEEEKPAKKTQKYDKNNKVCLFCLEMAQTFEKNVSHMHVKHGFFIAQEKFCTNKEGLIDYLQEKVEVGFMCITCDNKGAKDFNSGQAVRQHMNDRGHTFMKIEDGYEEYEKYYDFSALFKELLADQKGKEVAGIEFTEVQVYDDQNKEGDDDDWQDQSDSNQEENEEEWQSQGDEEQEENDEEEIKEKPNKKKKTIKYLIMKPTVTGNDQLLLPNGKILGHRKYRHIYRQNYQLPTFVHKLRMLTNTDTSAINNALITRERLVEIAKQDRLMERTNDRFKKKHLSVGMQQNIIIRKYFRVQNSL